MPINVITTDAQGLASVPLPTHGSTYTPVGHKLIIDEVIAELSANNFTLNNTEYRKNVNGEIAQGVYYLNYGNDSDMGLMFAWANSYDKTMRFRCAIGAYVFVCGNGLIAGDMSNYGRIHKGDAVKEVKDHIKSQIGNANVYFKELIQDKEEMKNVTITDEQTAELMGLLYFKESIISSSQLIVIKEQCKKPEHSYNAPLDSLWTVYNHITFALKKSHPKSWMEQQKNLHRIIKKKYMKVATLVDPNQLSILDSDQTSDIAAIDSEHEVLSSPVNKEEIAKELELLNLDNYFDSFDEDDEFQADAEMQEIKTEEIYDLEEVEEFDEVTEEIRDLDAEEDEDWDKLEEAGVIAEVIVPEATEEDTTEMLYGVDNGDIEITNAPINILAKKEEFPKPPINMPTDTMNDIGSDWDIDKAKEVEPTISLTLGNITAEIPLEEQVAGEVVEPVSEAELEVSSKPIVNQEDEIIDFNIEDNSNQKTLESPDFEF